MGNVRPLISEDIGTENVLVDTLIGYLFEEGSKYYNNYDSDFAERAAAVNELTKFLYALRKKESVKKDELSEIAQEIYSTLLSDVNSLSVEDKMKYFEVGRTKELQ